MKKKGRERGIKGDRRGGRGVKVKCRNRERGKEKGEN